MELPHSSPKRIDAHKAHSTADPEVDMAKMVLMLGAMTLLTGCAGMSDTQQRALTGTGIGAAGGAVIGAMAGNAGLGAAVGAGAGLVGGLLVDKSKKNEQAAYQSGFAAGKKAP